MAFVVVYDACVLYSSTLRDVLLRVALAELVQARWSERILDECFLAIHKNNPGLTHAQLARTRNLMNEAIPDAIVDNYQGIDCSSGLPDPGDAHVLAAAIRCSAQAIVTYNLRDFPASVLQPYDVEAIHPDDFVCAQIDLNERAMMNVLYALSRGTKSPPMNPYEICDRMANVLRMANAADQFRQRLWTQFS